MLECSAELVLDLDAVGGTDESADVVIGVLL